MSYLVSCGLGIFFNQIAIREILEGHSYFTLHFAKKRKKEAEK